MAATAALVAAGLLGCRGADRATAGCPSAESSAAPIDPPVMALLSAARARVRASCGACGP